MSFPAVSEDFLRRYDVEAPRYTSYPTVPVWSEAFGPAELASALAAAGDRLSLYVHLPFCRTMCAFCGCNMVVERDAQQVDEYLEALEAELQLVASRLGRRRSLAQIHWGGGTPTTLDELRIGALWQAIERHVDIELSAEVAIEIAPAVTTPSQLRLLRKLGFNRLSLGIQDLDPKVVESIHRFQSPSQIRELIELARELGFKGINVDLIYGLPHQTARSWAETLKGILALDPDRAAVYSFAYVPEVRHNQRSLPQAAMATGAEKLGLFKLAYEAFGSAGYRPIGMDHFAKADDELAIAQQRRTLRRNFQGYTVSPVKEVVAVGATGISDVGGAYAQNLRSLARYEERVRAGILPVARGIKIGADDLRRREIIQGLMCNSWVDLGPKAQSAFVAELSRLKSLERDGLVRLDGSVLEVTKLGQVFVRNVATVFDTYAPMFAGHARTV